MGEPLLPEYHGASAPARREWPSSDQARGERCRPSGPERGQIEEHVKRIARRLVARRKKRNANGSRGYQETAHKLIQFQQQQDRMGVQHELERLDRYEAQRIPTPG